LKAGELPNFIFAQSPKRLRIKMLDNNLVKHKTFVYSTPTFANGRWWVWYFEMPNDLVEYQEEKEVDGE
tara:strand:+ start:774 stop:980 length:207 start_codon:yes stop_codon:yes gene_type:complete